MTFMLLAMLLPVDRPGIQRLPTKHVIQTHVTSPPKKGPLFEAASATPQASCIGAVLASCLKNEDGFTDLGDFFGRRSQSELKKKFKSEARQHDPKLCQLQQHRRLQSAVSK